MDSSVNEVLNVIETVDLESSKLLWNKKGNLSIFEKSGGEEWLQQLREYREHLEKLFDKCVKNSSPFEKYDSDGKLKERKGIEGLDSLNKILNNVYLHKGTNKEQSKIDNI